MVDLQVEPRIACGKRLLTIPLAHLTRVVVPLENSLTKVFRVESLRCFTSILGVGREQSVLARLELRFVYIGVDGPPELVAQLPYAAAALSDFAHVVNLVPC